MKNSPIFLGKYFCPINSGKNYKNEYLDLMDDFCPVHIKYEIYIKYNPKC